MGRRTYEWVMARVKKFPHAEKETYVITRELRECIRKTRFYNDDLPTLIQNSSRNPARTFLLTEGRRQSKE
jgi:dihydrofolate reductase